jgi:hypothetical protein
MTRKLIATWRIRLFLAAEVSPEVARSASKGPSKSGMAYRGGGLAESLTDLELTR